MSQRLVLRQLTRHTWQSVNRTSFTSAAACRGFASKRPPLPTVPTCPSPTCECAEMPAMPEGLDIDHKSPMNGVIAGYAEQVLICTGKDDWPSKIEEENGGDNLAADLKELFGRGGTYADPFHNIALINSSLPSSVPPRAEVQSTSVYLLPSFKYVPFLPRVSFDHVQALAKGYLLPEKLHSAHDGLSPVHRDILTRNDAYQSLLHGVRDVTDTLVLICGHGGRDMRCGILGPLLRDEFEKQLERKGVEVLQGPAQVQADTEAQQLEGKVSVPKNTARVGLISHIGGHKFAGNIIIYVPPGKKLADGSSHPFAGHARTLNPAVAAILLIGGSAVYYLTTPSSREKVLNQDTFVPYTITSREAISATSFIFTVAPQHPNPSPSFLTAAAAADPSKRAAWRYPLWSVEFKQPEVQIARNYTPLPPLQGERLEDGKLRFYVRSISGGEMSTYLGRLGVGRQVWLRGTHPGFDVATRLGSQKNVVFLAGGTGVAPAMQVARAVLDSREDANFTLLWAIRSREELQQATDAPDKRPVSSSWWNWFRGTPRPQPTKVGHPITDASPLGRQLDEMKARYGNRLRIHVGVDDESSQFCESHIADAIQSSAAAPTLPSAPDCQPHNQKFHAPASEFEPNGARPCTCETGNRGKNLLMVSGPEGFISHYAGPKVWLGGVETQGAVGGVAAELRRRNPGFAADWLVLKL
ncbi:hypothetical protein MY4038_001401 [Beauveria bassiana]